MLIFILFASLFQLAPSVNFGQSTYGIDEDKGPLQLMLTHLQPTLQSEYLVIMDQQLVRNVLFIEPQHYYACCG